METILPPGLWLTNFDLAKEQLKWSVNYENFFVLYLDGKALIRMLKNWEFYNKYFQVNDRDRYS